MIRTMLQKLRITLTWANNGLGKTFIGAEKLVQFSNPYSLVICQKSKLTDWLNHFKTYYPDLNPSICTSQAALDKWLADGGLAIINYDLLSRRACLKGLRGHCLLLDESSLIQNPTAKRTRMILSMHPKQTILLSGTPTGGKYETLWTQLNLLGWHISKTFYWDRYIEFRIWDKMGFPLKIVTGYKNVPELKANLYQHNARFLKSSEVYDDLPSQTFRTLEIPQTKEYRLMLKDGISTLDGKEIVGDTNLTYRLALRELATVGKATLLDDILSSTEERVIIFYNFTRELLDALKVIDKDHISIMNGSQHDLTAYEQYDDSITFVQYQSGAMGLNLQSSRIMVFLSPPESSELYEQAKKRIHRIGQKKPCLYYNLIMSASIECRIYEALAERKNYTDILFRKDYGSRKAVRDKD